mgnify:FL=1
MNTSKVKLIAVFIFLSLTALVFSQAVIWEESFESADEDWLLDDNWTIENDMLQLYYSPTVENYDLAAVSPIISLPVNVGDLIVNQYISDYSAVDEVMEISVLHNEETSVLWSYDLLDGDWGSTEGTEISFSLAEFGGNDIKLQFRSYGSSTWNFNWWNILDLSITSNFDYDLAAVGIEGPSHLLPGEVGNWTITVENNGMETQDNYVIDIFRADGSLIESINSDTPIESNQTQSFDFDWSLDGIINTCLYFVVSSEDEEYAANNTSSSQYLRINDDSDLEILVWNNDNGSYYTDPEAGTTIGCEEGLLNALEINGINSNNVSALPSNLSDYDAVLITLGLYCVG